MKTSRYYPFRTLLRSIAPSPAHHPNPNPNPAAQVHQQRMDAFKKLSDEELGELHNEVEEEVKKYFDDMHEKIRVTQNRSEAEPGERREEEMDEEEEEHEEL